MAVPFGCDDGTLTTDSDLWTWCLWLMQAMEAFGRPLTAAQKWKELMEAAGFEDVVERAYKWPTNGWARDSHYKTLGQWVLYNMEQVMEPAILAPMTRSLGWTREEAIVLAARARRVLRDPKVHAYWPMYVDLVEYTKQIIRSNLCFLDMLFTDENHLIPGRRRPRYDINICLVEV
jgi:hypothetical protein